MSMYMLAPIHHQTDSIILKFEEDGIKVRAWYPLQVSISDYHGHFMWELLGPQRVLPREWSGRKVTYHTNQPCLLVVPLCDDSGLDEFMLKKENGFAFETNKEGMETFTLQVVLE